MRTVTYRLGDLAKVQIPIGFVGENIYTRVIIDSSEVYSEYPNAIVGMVVAPPVGDAYPAVVTRDGNNVLWDVSNSDLVYDGNGEIQLTFTVSEMVAKSYKARTFVKKSILPDGEAPEPLENFLEAASSALNAIPETIDEALAEAKASGEFDGEKGDPGDPGQPGQDGVSPSVSVTDITGGHRVTIVDANGTHTFDVMDGEQGDPGDPGDPGEPGQDGVSPTVSVSNITGGHRVVVTDANGDHTFDVMDGQQGSPGDPTLLIDDTAGSGTTNKTWSANKLASDVLSSINVLEPAATSGDVGKFLKAKTVADGKVTEYEFGSGGGGGGSDIDDTAGEGDTDKAWSA